MSEGIIRTFPGTLCMECSVGSEVAADAVFQIDGSNISPRMGRVVDGMLVVFDTESVFTTVKRVQCMSVAHNTSHSVSVFLPGKSRYTESHFHDMRPCVYMVVFGPPVITGMTTLNEGDTLYLECDTSNSKPRPTMEWFSPGGVNSTNERIIEIMNIQRSAAGIYTCVATHIFSGATMNSTVNVVVQCECSDSIFKVHYIATA